MAKSKLKELLAAAMCNVQAIQAAAKECNADAIGNADEATAAVNRTIIDSLELPKAERTAAQVELAKACAEAMEVARYYMDPTAPVTNRNRAGANGTSLQSARTRLAAAISGAGESIELSMAMVCPSGKRIAYGKAKSTPRPWHDAAGMLDAAARAVQARAKQVA